MTQLIREFNFLIKDQGMIVWLLIAAFVTSTAVVLGLHEIAQQRSTIENLIVLDSEEREIVQSKQSDWGGAAYYTFHLTFDEPSNFAFAAQGQRDIKPWKHRIRMLALEGQIYETDSSHPEFALVGRFDFAFVASYIAPLILIFLLFELRSREREEGRYELLTASYVGLISPWILRLGIKLSLLFVCLLIPIWIGGMYSGSSIVILSWASLYTLLHLVFWGLICLLVGRLNFSSSVNLIVGIAIWGLLGVIAPVSLRIAIDNQVTLPRGGEILLTQREFVNDAWDLPKEATMKLFLERHPEWSAYTNVNRPFEWKWYYAFQQVGDQEVEALSKSYRDGISLQEEKVAKLAWLSPPALLERRLQNLANTDVSASLGYEKRIRDYHSKLRNWYYPRLFKDTPFDASQLADLPKYQAKQNSN